MIPKTCQTAQTAALSAVHLRKEGATIGRTPVNLHPETVAVRFLHGAGFGTCPRFMVIRQAAFGCRMKPFGVPPMNSDERRAARRARRDNKRAANRSERIEGCTLESIADLYCIALEKNVLHDALERIESLCDELGIVINRKKTRIVKLSRGFVFLKKRFYFGDGGKVVVRPCRSSITRQRRKLKKQAALVGRGMMTKEQVNQSYQSWRGGMKRLDAHDTILRMDALYKELFG